LRERGYEGVLVGDEGGYGPRLTDNVAALHLLVEAVTVAGYQPRRDFAIAVDAAASHFHRDGLYHIPSQTAEPFTAAQMIDWLDELVDRFPIISLEDALAEDDWDGWSLLTSRLSSRVQLIGDDLFATNPQRLQRGAALPAANAILIKLNQIGTLSETLHTMQQALALGYQPVISARSGETEDITIADLAVATGAGQIKIGSVARSERLAKYNQLLRWDDESAGRWPFAGSTPLHRWRHGLGDGA
jgi:enolase